MLERRININFISISYVLKLTERLSYTSFLDCNRLWRTISQHSVSSSFLRSCSISSGVRKSIANLVGFFFCVDLIVLEKTCRPSVNKIRMTKLQTAKLQLAKHDLSLEAKPIKAESSGSWNWIAPERRWRERRWVYEQFVASHKRRRDTRTGVGGFLHHRGVRARPSQRSSQKLCKNVFLNWSHVYRTPPGVDEILNPIANCVNGVKARLEAWIHISLVGTHLGKTCTWQLKLWKIYPENNSISALKVTWTPRSDTESWR